MAHFLQLHLIGNYVAELNAHFYALNYEKKKIHELSSDEYRNQFRLLISQPLLKLQ